MLFQFDSWKIGIRKRYRYSKGDLILKYLIEKGKNIWTKKGNLACVSC